MKVWVLHRFDDYGDSEYIRLYTTWELALAAVMADIDRYGVPDSPGGVEAVKREAREAMYRENSWWPSREYGYAITEEIVHDQEEGGVI